jgi:hypothetical protein
MMQNSKTRFAFALLVPALLALSISEAPAQKQQRTVGRCDTSRMFQASQRSGCDRHYIFPRCDFRDKRERLGGRPRMCQTKWNLTLMPYLDTAAAPFELQPI